MAFEKSDLSIVTYGLYLTCITSITLTINPRHTHGMFAMKCITMCSDMNIFKHRFIQTNNTSLIQITFKVNMRFFFASVYLLDSPGLIETESMSILSNSVNSTPYLLLKCP